MNSQTDQPQQPYTYTPIITTVAMPLLIFGRDKKKEESQAQTQQPTEQAPPPKPKPKKHTGLTVQKYEIAEDKLKFSALKGFFKKRWVVIKEFPLSEISAVEFEGNWLSLTWKDENQQFMLKKKTDSFAQLNEELQAKIEEQHQNKLKAERAALQRSELLAALNTFLPAVDASFDVLMGLHEKRVNWPLLENIVEPLGGSLSFKAQELLPLELDFAKVAAAIKSEVPNATSKEAFAVLKAIHGYFETQKPEDDWAEALANFEQVKELVLAYYTLNDMMFAKVIGEQDNAKETAAFEAVLLDLAEKTNFKLTVDGLKDSFEALGVDEMRGEAVVDVRLLFRTQLKQF
ncbi:MAG: hypothetical protein ACQCN6_14190 [Candidatus Bathyarchaeia archaeon]|jgi:hypothetical protein